MSVRNDDKLLHDGLAMINEACGYFIEMKNPIGTSLHHMADSILCYVEEYIYKNEDVYKLSRPKKSKKNDSTA